jgi:hypothetical protein
MTLGAGRIRKVLAFADVLRVRAERPELVCGAKRRLRQRGGLHEGERDGGDGNQTVRSSAISHSPLPQ